MTHGVRPNLANSNEHHHVNETRGRVHIPTDHDRLTQERYNARIDILRTTGRITIFEAEWYKHHYVVDEGWEAPDDTD